MAVYSDADAKAQHVQMADEAFWIGGSAPAESYLDAQKVLQAALRSGAEAVHPAMAFCLKTRHSRNYAPNIILFSLVLRFPPFR